MRGSTAAREASRLATEREQAARVRQGRRALREWLWSEAAAREYAAALEADERAWRGWLGRETGSTGGVNRGQGG